jgi:hypothetical protein
MRVEPRILLVLGAAFRIPACGSGGGSQIPEAGGAAGRFPGEAQEGERPSRFGIPVQAKMAGSFFSTQTSESFLMRT